MSLFELEEERERPSSWSPSPLRRLARRRGVYWTVAATLAVAAGVAVHQQGQAARQVVDRLGTTTDVLVSSSDLVPGDPIAPLTAIAAVPTGLAPAAAVAEVPAGSVAGRHVAAGAMITALDVADPTQPAADEATIAVASSTSTPPLDPGDRARLVIAADPFLGLEPRIIDATVVAVDDERLIVAVAADDLADVAAALQAGGITVAAGP